MEEKCKVIVVPLGGVGRPCGKPVHVDEDGYRYCEGGGHRELPVFEDEEEEEEEEEE